MHSNCLQLRLCATTLTLEQLGTEAAVKTLINRAKLLPENVMSLAVYADAEGDVRVHFTLSPSWAAPATPIFVIKVLI